MILIELRADVSKYRPEIYTKRKIENSQKNSQSSTRSAININVMFTFIRQLF